MDHGLGRLVGKRITAVRNDGDFLVFWTDAGTVSFLSYGDCCAQCYFDELESPELPERGALCLRAELGDWQEWPEGTDDTNEQCFGKVDTEAGTITFTLRLSHNGYYGGSMEFAEHHVPRP